MLKITGADVEPEGYGTDFAATWSAVQGLLPAFQSICSSRRTLVICDEHHHAAIEAPGVTVPLVHSAMRLTF